MRFDCSIRLFVSSQKKKREESWESVIESDMIECGRGCIERARERDGVDGFGGMLERG